MSPEAFVISLLLVCGGLLSSEGAQDSGHVGKFVNTNITWFACNLQYFLSTHWEYCTVSCSLQLGASFRYKHRCFSVNR